MYFSLVVCIINYMNINTEEYTIELLINKLECRSGTLINKLGRKFSVVGIYVLLLFY